MRKFKIFVFFILLTLFLSPDLFGQPSSGWWQRRHRHHNGPGPTIGAPLDGGILVALGAAGIGYFVIRKRKKNN